MRPTARAASNGPAKPTTLRAADLAGFEDGLLAAHVINLLDDGAAASANTTYALSVKKDSVMAPSMPSYGWTWQTQDIVGPLAIYATDGTYQYFGNDTPEHTLAAAVNDGLSSFNHYHPCVNPVLPCVEHSDNLSYTAGPLCEIAAIDVAPARRLDGRKVPGARLEARVGRAGRAGGKTVDEDLVDERSHSVTEG